MSLSSDGNTLAVGAPLEDSGGKESLVTVLSFLSEVFLYQQRELMVSAVTTVSRILAQYTYSLGRAQHGHNRHTSR